jgi:hypothetical protein
VASSVSKSWPGADADGGEVPGDLEADDFDDPASVATALEGIAAVTAIAVTEHGHEGATYTLTGRRGHPRPDRRGTADALGREVTFTDVPPEALRRQPARTCRPGKVEGLLEDYAHYRRGEAASVPRRSPRSPAGRPSPCGSSPATTPRRSATRRHGTALTSGEGGITVTARSATARWEKSKS